MKHLLIIFILLNFALTTSSSAQEDCSAYLQDVVADFELLNTLQATNDMTSMEDVGFLLYSTYDLRHRYEDLSTVPECAVNLHPLIIRYLAAQGDVLALSMAWYSDVSHRSEYEVRLPLLLARVQEAETDLNAELVVLDVENLIQSSLAASNAGSASTSPTGTRSNPIPLGTPYSFGGIGTMSVLESRWTPGQTGLAILYISFTCDRPSDQTCDLFQFLFDVVGDNGQVYQQVFELGLPEPIFGNFLNPQLFGGGTSEGYLAFRISERVTELQLRVRVLFDEEVFFSLTQ